MKRNYLFIFIFSLFLAFISVNLLFKKFEKDRRSELLNFVTTVASAINPDRINNLNANQDDYSNPDYLRLRQQLTNLSNTNPQIRYLYLMASRGDIIYFLVDSQPDFINGQKTDETVLSSPGEIYSDATPALKQVFTSVSTKIIGPETDKWGTFISALTPIVDPDTNRMAAILGADVEIGNWLGRLWWSCFPSCLVVFLILLVEIIFFYFLSRNSDHRDRLLFLASVLESSDDAIYSTDLNGLVKSWNYGAEKIYGYSLAEAMGSSIKDLIVPPSRWPETERNLQIVKNGQSQNHIETVRKRKSGQEFPVWLTISPVYSAQKVVGLSVIARDISQQKKTEEEIISRNRQLEKINRLMINREIRIKELKKLTQNQ